jgi:hypothetical protein
MNSLNPKKLLLTKWTTVKQLAKQKHFLVSRLLQPDDPTAPIERVEIKVMFSKTAHDESCRTTVCGGRVGFDAAKTGNNRCDHTTTLNVQQHGDLSRDKRDGQL